MLSWGKLRSCKGDQQKFQEVTTCLQGPSYLEQFWAGVRVNKLRGDTYALEGPRDVYKARRVHRISRFTSHIVNDPEELNIKA